MQELRVEDIKSIILRIKTIIDLHQDFLMQLDSVMGDGDLGFTMTKGFAAASQEARESEENFPGKMLIRIGMVIAKTSPSTMGTLVATGFMKGGKALGETEVIDPGHWPGFLNPLSIPSWREENPHPATKPLLIHCIRLQRHSGRQ